MIQVFLLSLLRSCLGFLLPLAMLFNASELKADQAIDVQTKIQSAKIQGSFYAVSVASLEEMSNWYGKHLGFKVVSRGENAQRKGALLIRENILLELAEFKGATKRDVLKPALESHMLHGIFKLGFIVDDIDSVFAAMNAAKVDVFFAIVNASDDQRTFGIKDPEGNVIQFFGR